MKITKQQLKQIIKEELNKMIQETHTRPEDTQRARDFAAKLSAGRIGSHPESVRTELVNLFKLLAPGLDDEGAKKLAIMVAGLIPAASANIEQDLGLEEKKKKKDKWMQDLDPEHKGYCTPMTKKTCTPKRKALAKRFKKAAKKKKKRGGTGWQGKV